jgi:hypothetical protein
LQWQKKTFEIAWHCACWQMVFCLQQKILSSFLIPFCFAEIEKSSLFCCLQGEKREETMIENCIKCVALAFLSLAPCNETEKNCLSLSCDGENSRQNESEYKQFTVSP